MRYVHQLVLELFVGPRPRGKEARHFPDQNPANNHVSNLSWTTAVINQRDRIANGTDVATCHKRRKAARLNKSNVA